MYYFSLYQGPQEPVYSFLVQNIGDEQPKTASKQKQLEENNIFDSMQAKRSIQIVSISSEMEDKTLIIIVIDLDRNCQLTTYV